jgi:hypothetical protein
MAGVVPEERLAATAPVGGRKKGKTMIKKCIVQGCGNMAEDTHNGIITAPWCDHHLETECILAEDGETYLDTGRPADPFPLLCEHRGKDGERDCEDSPTHVVPTVIPSGIMPPFVYCTQHFRAATCQDCGNPEIVSAMDTDGETAFYCQHHTDYYRSYVAKAVEKPRRERTQ